MTVVERMFHKKDLLINPVLSELESIKRVSCKDIYFEKTANYLEFALRCGLCSSEIVLSCRDLASTLTGCFQEDEIKKRNWEKLRQTGLSKDRPRRKVDMKLYPKYFRAILDGVKKYEGRAFDPNSEKNYPDLTEGDEIVFSIDRGNFEREQECNTLGLNPSWKMTSTVGQIYYSPTVHGIYQFTSAVGREFQPMIYGASELLELQRAAVYYTFPGYQEKIAKYGFLGIELKFPEIV